jgi:hypothetical protein
MTRSIITGGSATTNEKIPKSKGDDTKLANQAQKDKEDKGSDKSLSQEKSNNFPEAKSQHN